LSTSKKSSDQIAKFKEAARALETDEDEDKFNSTLKTIAQASGEARAVVHASDCALHDAPAYEAGSCTCGALKAGR
jgi:hypothetical protein